MINEKLPSLRKLYYGIIFLIVPFICQAEGHLIDGLYYNLNIETKTATVTYKGYRSSLNISYVTGDIVIPATIEYDDEKYSVTQIGDCAFYNCSDLNTIEIPTSVTSIRFEAFAYSGLTSIVIPNSITSIGEKAFERCSELKTITYSNSISVIEFGTFNGCSSLEEVSIPESVTTIDSGAFMSCSNLKKVTIPNSVTSISSCAFQYCESLEEVIIPKSVTTILAGAFNSCGNLKRIYFNAENCNSSFKVPDYREGWLYNSPVMEVFFGESVKSIPEYAFCNCRNLCEVNIPNNVSVIGKGCFSECSNLTKATLPNTLNKIDEFTFNECSSLTHINIPNSITIIGMGAFQGCSSLANIEIPNSVVSIGSGAFNRCSSLTEITIPSSVTSIETMSFSQCSNLKTIYFNAENCNSCYFKIGSSHWLEKTPVEKVIISDNIKTVPDYAFYDVTTLKKAIVNAELINFRAFSGCTNLSDLCLNVQQIKYDAFANTGNLKNIYSLTPEPPLADLSSFSEYSGVKLFVPYESLAAYKNAEPCWCKFYDITESDFKDIDSIFTAGDKWGRIKSPRVDSDVNISVTEGILNVEAFESKRISIYNLSGTCVYSCRGSVNISLPSGIYFVSVDKKAIKIAIR